MAVAVKSDNKVLREHGETVYLPFGCEYSILIKNLNSLRAYATVTIDGQDATEGCRLIVPANDSIELERFIKKANMNAGNRFKFIERTAGIEAHRGIKVDDGLIRVEFEFEREPAPIKPYPHYDYRLLGGSGIVGAAGGASGSLYNSTSVDSSFYDASYSTAASASVAKSGALRSRGIAKSATARSAAPQAQTETGITVAGSISEQKFEQGAYFATDGVKHVLIIKMAGELGQNKVEKPVFVHHKAICGSCGKSNSPKAKFCSECGTGLEIVAG